MVLIDSSVLIDLLEQTPQWHVWSANTLHQLAQEDTLAINAVVFAEIAISFADLSKQQHFLSTCGIAYAPIPAPAARAANVAHQQYRAAGGGRNATLPDFFIGAHAEHEGWRLITRDAKRIKTYFPNVTLITPDTHP